MLYDAMTHVGTQGMVCRAPLPLPPRRRDKRRSRGTWLPTRFQLSRSNERDIRKDDNRLDELVPHLLLEYKLSILKAEMKEVMQQLQSPEVMRDAGRTMDIMKRYKQLQEIMKEISKRTGDRILG